MENELQNNLDQNIIKICWTGGAGFVITCGKIKIGVDIYLSDACREQDDSFKRLTLAPYKAEDLKLDYLISTHNHGDHFDVISVPIMMEQCKDMKIIAPTSVIKFADKLGYNTKRFIQLDRGMQFETENIKFLAVTADHGEESPDAIGVILEFSNKKIFFSGDGAYHDNYTDYTMGIKGFDVMLVAINGTYGNPDSAQASNIAAMLEVKTVIPCHYWLFKEHGGDPMTFVTACIEKSPLLEPKVLAIGEEYVIETK